MNGRESFFSIPFQEQLKVAQVNADSLSEELNHMGEAMQRMQSKLDNIK